MGNHQGIPIFKHLAEREETGKREDYVASQSQGNQVNDPLYNQGPLDPIVFLRVSFISSFNYYKNSISSLLFFLRGLPRSPPKKQRKLHIL